MTCKKRIICLLLMALSIYLAGCGETKKVALPAPDVFPVLSVNLYPEYKTNNFGGIISTRIKYVFQYLDGEEIKVKSGYEETDVTHIRLSDNGSNYYVETYDIDRSRILYLTEKTLNKIEIEL